jgi:hypothetical protein
MWAANRGAEMGDWGRSWAIRAGAGAMGALDSDSRKRRRARCCRPVALSASGPLFWSRRALAPCLPRGAPAPAGRCAGGRGWPRQDCGPVRGAAPDVGPGGGVPSLIAGSGVRRSAGRPNRPPSSGKGRTTRPGGSTRRRRSVGCPRRRPTSRLCLGRSGIAACGQDGAGVSRRPGFIGAAGTLNCARCACKAALPDRPPTRSECHGPAGRAPAPAAPGPSNSRPTCPAAS